MDRVDELQEWVPTISPNSWFALSHWGKETNQLNSWERSLAYTIGRLVSRGIGVSTKQAQHAHRIYQRAKQLGFEED